MRWIVVVCMSYLSDKYILAQEMLIEPLNQGRLGFISGLVPKAKAIAFERILFRATRGNMYLKQAAVEEPVTDPVSGEKVRL